MSVPATVHRTWEPYQQEYCVALAPIPAQY